jgi:hypothetical protein
VSLLQVLRVGATDAIAERARQRLAHLGVPTVADDAASLAERAETDPSAR